MPIRQNILRKGKAPKQNLLEFDVFQEETGVLGDLSTSRFFKISEFPSVLPTGNSSFLIEGSDLLKPNVELKTELLDSAGNPIFHYAIPNYDKELPARRITIEVYEDDVINGIGSFTVLGELDPRKIEVPTAFQNTYNIRFSAPISINKNIKNTQPIRFYGDPRLTVSELVKGVIQPVYTGNQRTKTITGSVSLNVTTTTIPADYGAENSTTADSTQFDEVGGNQAAYISQNAGEAQSSILGNTNKKSEPRVTYVVEEMEKGVDNELNKITSTMKGATLSINRPDLLVDTSVYPNAKFTKPTTFSTKILDVLNSTSFTTNTQYKIKSKTNNQEYIVPLNASSSGVTITHNVGSVVRTASTVFQRSFANMTVGNLRTFSGDTYKAKIYAKEDGTSGEFEKIYETLVESPNELLDQNSNSGFKSVGIFATQSIVDNFWVSSSNTFTATQDDDTLIDGILLSGSTEPNANSFTFETSQSYSLEKNEPYLVDFNVAFKPQNKVQSDGTTKKDAKLEVFLTGTFLSETSQEVALGEVDLGEFDFNKVNTFTKVEKRQVSDFLTHNIEGGVATGSLGFRLHSGEFILSDIRLRPFSETNFSPGFFKANVPMPPAIKRGQPYDFVVEFYDANNSLAEAVAVADDVVFAGPRQVLGDGDDGILTGSVFLSNTEDSGIEFHGGSAYIRSVGYNGFDRAEDEGGSGFMMFSGSVSKSLNTSQSYNGVGIELIDASPDLPSGSRFLKFRTSGSSGGSEFEVKTDTFLFGIKGVTNNYISGSNGNLEISSSNFALQEDGDVIIEGTISAAVGGTIGGFNITTGSLDGGTFFISGSASGSAGTFDKGNLFISSSGFQVNSQGDIRALSGQVAGWDIIGDTLSSLNSSDKGIILDADASTPIITIQEDSDNKIELFHTTATNFGLIGTSGGDVVFRLGSTNKIGGFSITENTISSSNNNLILRDNGQITASAVQVTGDVNATGGTVANSIIGLGEATQSLTLITGSVLAFTGSAQSSLNTIGGATASLQTATASLQEASSSLSTASQSMQTQVVLDSGGMALKSGDGSKTLADYGATSKVFDGENNNTFVEVGGKGVLLVSGSKSGSLFSSDGFDIFDTNNNRTARFAATTQIGDTSKEHIQISGSGLEFKSGSTAKFQIHDKGIQIGSSGGGISFDLDGNATFNGSITINASDLPDGTVSGSAQLADDISGSSAGVSASAASAHSASKELRTQIVLDSGGMALKNAAANKTLADYGATTKIFDGENNNTFVEVGGKGIIIVSGSVTGSLFSAETSSFFGTGSNKHDRIEIVGEGLNVYKNNKQVTSIGEDVVVGQQASGQSNVQITSGALNFRNNATTIFSIANDGTVTFNSSDVRTLLSGSLGQHAANIRTLSATTVSGSSISGSTSANTTAEVGISGSTSATATAEVGVSSSAAVTSDMADTRAQLVLDNSSANNQKINLVNSTGGIMSSFGRAVKFFGSASNALVTSSANGTVHYTEINPDGVLLVANSETASLFAANTSSIFGGAGTNPEHERVEVTATGLKVYQNNKQLTNIGANGLDVFDTSNNRVGRFAATTQIGNTSNEHIQISSSGLEIFDGSTRYIGIQGTGMQIGSVANGITLDTSGDATFNGSITINASDLPDGTVSGSAQLADDISGSSTLISASAASANSSSIALTTQVVLDSGGMALKDQSGNTLADYGTDIQLGVVASNKRNILIDVDSGVNIRNNTTNIAQFGSDVTLTGGTITINDGTRDRLVIDANDITMTDESGNTAFNLDTNVLTLGEVASNQENIVIDPTNGVRLRTNTTTHAQLTADKFVMGEVGNDKSRVEVESGGVKIINRQSSTDTTMIEFKDDGDITSGDFLIERSRLFGAGNDGDIVLKSNDCTVSNGQGSAARVNSSTIRDENGTTVCERVGSTWSLKGDLYAKSLEVDNSVAATTLITSGSRLFVQGTLTIDSSCIIHNDGHAGSNGADGAESDNSANDNPTAGGHGGAGNALTSGSQGQKGSRGGNPSGIGTAFGGNGGGGGGSGGIVFIAARTIVNNGTIRSHGGAGGTGGDGFGNGDSAGGTGPAAGTNGNDGSVIHIKV